jgi:hypothetical protein
MGLIFTIRLLMNHLRTNPKPRLGFVGGGSGETIVDKR